jgi:preprotein translocase subunit YajC
MDMPWWFQSPPAPQQPAAPSTTTSTQQPAEGAPAGGAAPQGQPGMSFFIPIILMFVVMYFLMIRPQRKQAKERENMIANLKKDDHVVTHAGLYGVIKAVKDGEFTLLIDEAKDVRVRVAKSAIAGLVRPSGTESEAPEKAKS